MKRVHVVLLAVWLVAPCAAAQPAPQHTRIFRLPQLSSTSAPAPPDHAWADPLAPTRPATQPSAAGPTEADWRALSAVRRGTLVRIVADDGTVHRGTLNDTDQSSASLSTSTGMLSLTRSRVRRVEVAVGTHRRRHAWLGLAAGAVAGGLVVAVRCQGRDSSCSEVAPAWVYPAAGVGVLAGALMPPGTAWKTLFSTSVDPT